MADVKSDFVAIFWAENADGLFTLQIEQLARRKELSSQWKAIAEIAIKKKNDPKKIVVILTRPFFIYFSYSP